MFKHYIEIFSNRANIPIHSSQHFVPIYTLGWREKCGVKFLFLENITTAETRPGSTELQS